ncbi:MarR family winged helix-turn-helix transcriptional regulator [Streptomyces albireticuli]|uniref:MarR family transcriptional regulator n=1 Tax=Streptomyces albireticuli TaxID=1940 RepID=A0A2A2DGH0_9ACTN|nr:MarR family transcriptional regulator [Streptomyces albireticuli]MCD9141849.1 MarR family transcriptional regulator [Streptomyces albireticuli]MCD9163207.1 MarR family transcriptional regulator [Streptomyces albireticuli]MCD9190022.1 MarR family transcriptional regulator [Streptomyces albireticuli]PAU50634.1 MarR family transcriptional regulator [Streptomyces albireticuli]
MTTHPPSTPPPPSAAERAWGNIRQIVLGGNERRKEVVEALGMSFFRVKALRRIARGPVTLRDLADELLTDRPYTTLVVADLAERGLVERTANPADRRSKIVSVTEEGRAAAERAERILGAPPSALLALPEEDLAALDRITAKLAAPGGAAGSPE